MNTKTKLSAVESLQIFVKALGVSIKAKHGVSILISILGFPLALMPVLISLSLSRLSNIVHYTFIQNNKGWEPVIQSFVMLIALYLIQQVYTSLKNYYASVDRLSIQCYNKEYILRCCSDVKYKYIDNYDDFKDKIRFVDSDAGNRVAGTVQTIIAWFQDLVTFVSIIIALSGVDVRIVIILCVASVPAVILSYFQKDEEYMQKVKWTKEFNMTVSYFFEATWAHSMNEVRFFGVFSYIKDKWRDMKNKQIQQKNKLTAKHVLFNSLADLFRNGVYIAVLIITAMKIFDNPSVGIGTFMLVYTLASSLQDTATNIFIRVAQFFSDISYMKDFFDLEKLEHEERNANVQPLEQYGIEINNISFTYPNTENIVLSNLTLKIREGEKVAIIGENGSGKTTLVNLICGLYEPETGEVLVGGKSVNTNLSETKRTISAIFQDFGQYEGTINENIVVSDVKKPSSESEIIDISRKTGAVEIIQKKPNGLNEQIGNFSVTGEQLSGGEWQKIALTRCAYRDSAKIMILDEPTAALDPIAEANLYRNFTELTGSRTSILISHRLGITSLVDRIIVLDDGKVAEDGDHATLLSQDGLYAKMYQAQAQWYE